MSDPIGLVRRSHMASNPRSPAHLSDLSEQSDLSNCIARSIGSALWASPRLGGAGRVSRANAHFGFTAALHGHRTCLPFISHLFRAPEVRENISHLCRLRRYSAASDVRHSAPTLP